MIKVNLEPPRNILVVQHRLDGGPEQKLIENILGSTDANLVLVNTLTDSEPVWQQNTRGPFSGVISLGSSDVDRAHPTGLLAKHDNRMFPLLDNLGYTEVLGVCLTHQTAAEHGHGKVKRHRRKKEAQTVTLRLTADGKGHPIFDGLGDEIDMVAVHYDTVVKRPKDAVVLATTRRDRNSVLQRGRHITFQAHPELDAIVVRELFTNSNENRTELGMKPYRKTGEFTPVTNQGRVLVNFVNGLPPAGEIFQPVPIVSPPSNR